MSNKIRIGISYPDHFIDEFYVSKEEVVSLKKVLVDEAKDIFVVGDQEFAKKDVASVTVGGNWAVQYFDPSLLKALNDTQPKNDS